MINKRSYTGVEIAVIGMDGRFPGANNIEEFWHNIENDVESITFLTDNELLAAGVNPEQLNNPDFVKSAGGVMQGKEYFDASFFGYTPREAQLLDPQVRVLHESVWNALENSGYNPSSYNGLIGLYVGASPNLYWKVLAADFTKNNDLSLFESSLLFDKDFMATRISYKLDLKGPAVNIQSACSTSLVAVHMACRALITGECDMAIAGGVSISTQNDMGYVYQKGMINSQDGHCRAFDNDANGTVSGSGVGVVVLKRLKNAIEDGDHISAVILASAINNDGSRKVGYTAPSIEGQANAIKSAHRLAKINPESVTYIETHGTGTPLGDQVEIEALKMAFNTTKKGFCRIGSVKTNIGHLDTAAGVTGLIKSVMALKNKKIPSSLHYNEANNKGKFEESPFVVNNKLTDWKTDIGVLRAGVSSFGVGGTNAHIVLEEAPLREANSTGRDNHMLLFSAKTEAALNASMERFVSYLKNNMDINLGDVAYTLQVGRKAFKYRSKIVCSNVDEAIKELSDPTSRKVHKYASKHETKQVIFMFAGLGSQYINMAKELYDKEALFRNEADSCLEIIKDLAGYDLKDIIYTDNPDEKLEYKLQDSEIAQLAIFTLEYSLAKLLISWGVKPDAMIGYSFGEYVAACIAGVLTQKEALHVIIQRSRLINKLPKGDMISIPLSVDEVKKLLGEKVTISIDNGMSCIIAGKHEEINSIEQRLKSKKIMCTHVHNSHAIHTSLMEPILDDFKKVLSQVTLNKPEIPFISSVTGKWVIAEEVMKPEYWIKHLSQTVLFDTGIREILKQQNSILIEIGPGSDLSSLLTRYSNKDERHHVINLIRQPQQNISDELFLLNKLSAIWLHGIDINWKNYYKNEIRYRIPLPTYPFERQKFWIDGDASALCSKLVSGTETVVKRPELKEWFNVPAWEQSVLPSSMHDDVNTEKCKWLVFADDSKFSSSLISSLKESYDDVITVKIGDNYQKNRSDEYIVSPALYDNYESLFTELKEQGMLPNKIIHLWNITQNTINHTTLECLNESLNCGLYSLINIMQVLGKLNMTCDIQLHVITNNMLKVIGEEILYPEKATILGVVKVAPLEYFNINCRCIDLVIPENKSNQEKLLIDNLKVEFLTNSNEKVVAYRGDCRWTQTYKSVQLNKSDNYLKRFREGGVYLVTGGFGGMGFSIAKHLAATYRARLILIGRSKFPEKNQWNDWLQSHDENDRISVKIRKMMDLENAGAKFMIFSADISDYKEMHEIITQAENAFGQINGVIHTAGVADYAGVIQRRSQDMTEAVLAPKVKGTLVIEELLKNRKLDFLALFSSIGNVFYGYKFGQVGYNAANEFLDAYTHYKALTSNVFTVTINWCDWLEVGMGVAAIKRKYQGNNKEINYDLELPDSIYPDEGVEVFKRVLNTSLSRVIIVPNNLNQLLIEMNSKLDDVKSSVIKNVEETTLKNVKYQRPELSSEYESPRNKLEEKLVKIWGEGFGIEKIGIHDNFFEMGGDSLKGIMFVNRYEKLLNEIVHLIVIFQCPTIAELTEYFITNYSEAVGRIMDIEIVNPTGKIYDSNVGIIDDKKIEEVRKLMFVPTNNYEKLNKKNKKAIFILSPPRSGSTLLRVILAGHPKLFAPPELHLLAFNTLKDTALSEVNTSRQACVRVIMELKGCDVIEAEKIYDEFLAQDTSTLEFYKYIQSFLEDRLLIDKTPGYSYYYDVLKRAEESFDEPIYIHLLRHPYGMIHSYEEAKLDLQRDKEYMDAIYEVCNSRREVAELEWTICHQNINKFLDSIPQNRQYKVRFEDIVMNPQKEVVMLCEFLGIEFDDKLLETYDDSKKRMTDGNYEGGIMIGDVKFHKHKRIEALVADNWRNTYKGDFLGAPTLEIAEQFGYKPIGVKEYASIKQAVQKEFYPASSVQKRLYTLQQMNINNVAYNMPTILELYGNINKEKLVESFVKLIKRHESLRTSFHIIDNEIVQKIADDFEFTINNYFDKNGDVQNLINSFIKPFNLSAAPLVRVGLIQKDERSSVLIIDMHHIITDAVSNDILVRDFMRIYSDEELEPVRFQYKDYSEWQRSENEYGFLAKQREYWLKRLKSDMPELKIHTDFKRPEIQSFEGDIVDFEIGVQETLALNSIARDESSTLYLVLLSMFNVLLSKISSQKDIIIGTPVVGRRHLDTENIVGMFANTLVLRNSIEDNMTFVDLLRTVKQNTLSDFQYQDYPFEELVNRLVKDRDLSRNPIFDVMFKMQNPNVAEVALTDLTLKSYEYKTKTSPFDFTLKVFENKEIINGQFEYCTEVFKKETIHRYVKYFKDIARQVIEDKNIRIQDIDMKHSFLDAKAVEDMSDFAF